jgi:D-arabinose 1-dehydrogenase-like Zn-dependent alcohol dehydrogenase
MADRTDAEIRRDLALWERELDLHLGHCEVCSEASEMYCKAGAEISYMVTSLMMERVRLQTKQAAEGKREPQMNADGRG